MKDPVGIEITDMDVGTKGIAALYADSDGEEIKLKAVNGEIFVIDEFNE